MQKENDLPLLETTQLIFDKYKNSSQPLPKITNQKANLYIKLVLLLEDRKYEADISNRRVFEETKHLFIVKEQETGKIPYARKKWRKIIEMIKK